MLRTLGIVEACFDSPAARARASRRLGGKSVLEWVARRATECLQLDGVIIVTDDAPENRFVSRLAPGDIPVCVAQKPDPLACFAAALEEYKTEAAVRIGVASPFLDPGLVDRLVLIAQAHEDLDYVTYCLHDGRPVVFSPLGFFAEWARSTAVHRAARRATDPLDRAAATRFFYSHAEAFQVRLVPLPEPIDRDDVRLALDSEEDWDNAQSLLEALGPDLDCGRIAALLNHQPALRRRMAALNRQHARN